MRLSSGSLSFVELALPTNSPVTCGSGESKDLIFGHADGSLEDFIG